VIALTSTTEADTIALGRRLGATLEPGAAVLLTGPLGAGKTAFVRGLAQGLGLDPDEVSSPTFTIVQEYTGRVRLQHVDLFRLTPVEVDDLALEDLWEGSVMAVEWPDRWLGRPADAISVDIEPVGETARRITITGARPGSWEPPS
jgi:tRNA threonylcarbamoyladenosine biosynthesis protein TsaE